MTIEAVMPLFFDTNAIRVPNSKIYRIYTPKGRYYYTVDLNSETVDMYIGVTTMIAALVPKGEGLIKWMADLGYEKAKVYANVKAQYGTLMHNEIAKFLISGYYDVDSLPSNVREYIDKCDNKSYINAEEWVNDMYNDMLAFAKFCYDYQIKPIAIEIMLCHPDGYAGTIDLLCSMTIKEKIDSAKRATENNLITKTIIAAVDFKSGRKGFYDEYAIQLESYRHLIHNEWPDLVVEKIYNWSPKEWRTEPSYNLKDQSDSVDAMKFNMIVELAKIELMKIPGSYMKPKGILRLGELNDDILSSTNIIEYILDHHRNKYSEHIELVNQTENDNDGIVEAK